MYSCMKFSKINKKLSGGFHKVFQYRIVFSADRDSFSSSFLSLSLYSQDLEHYPEEMWRGVGDGFVGHGLIMFRYVLSSSSFIEVFLGRQVELHKCLFALSNIDFRSQVYLYGINLICRTNLGWSLFSHDGVESGLQMQLHLISNDKWHLKIAICIHFCLRICLFDCRIIDKIQGFPDDWFLAHYFPIT